MPVNRVVITLACLASLACGGSSNSAGSRAKAGPAEAPWSRADYNDRNGWWMNWKVDSLPFDVGTRFEIEHVAADGAKTMETLVVTSVTRRDGDRYSVHMKSGDGKSLRRDLPPSARYSPGRVGYITTRNAKRVAVSVPAGDFVAARMFTTEKVGGETHEVDEWVAPDLPVTIQVWSRRPRADAYDPPPDAVIPLGNAYSRLVSIERQ